MQVSQKHCMNFFCWSIVAAATTTDCALFYGNRYMINDSYDFGLHLFLNDSHHHCYYYYNRQKAFRCIVAVFFFFGY